MKEIHLNLLRYLEANPQVSQRELADHLGVSLGKTNYCLRALVDKGLVKARNFKNNKHKRAYLYILTPAGMETKARITARFLQRKMDEYEVLKAEIEALQSEVNSTPTGTSPRQSTEPQMARRHSTDPQMAPRQSTDLQMAPRQSTDLQMAPRQSTDPEMAPRQTNDPRMAPRSGDNPGPSPTDEQDPGQSLHDFRESES